MGKVVVVGSINVDFAARVARLPGRGETVRASSVVQSLGGKGANQAVAARRAGADVRLVGAVGQDAPGEAALAQLAAIGVTTQEVARTQLATGVAYVTVDPTDNQIVVAPGANIAINPAQVTAAPLDAGDICLAQLETTSAIVKLAFAKARAVGATTLLNPAPAVPEDLPGLLELADIIVANETEWVAIMGQSGVPQNLLGQAAADPRLGRARALVATLGDQGLVAWFQGRLLRLDSHQVETVDTTGAGDCFCGYLAAGLALGEDFADALIRANAAAALAVCRAGAADSIPTRQDVEAFLAQCRG